jgi:D-hexose-6-phosphate mutarotase
VHVANSSADGLPSDGFARNSTWTYAGSEERGEGSEVSLLFHLGTEELIPKYRDVWPYRVNLTYNVTLERNGLVTSFRVYNGDEKDIDFQFLLHSYLSTTVRFSSLSRHLHQLTYNHII